MGERGADRYQHGNGDVRAAGDAEPRAIRAQAERLARAWFPSFRDDRFRVFTFFLEYNHYLNCGASALRRVFDDKLLLSGFLAGIGVRTPVTRWIVVGDSALDAKGERISTREMVEQLLPGRWFVKPRMGMGAHGAFLLQDGIITSAEGHSEQTDSATLLKLLQGGDCYLVQDVVVQSAEYAVFASSSVNTVRCLTFLPRAGPPEVVAATLRMGNGRSVVDNKSSGGIYCGIDLETQRLIGPGRSKDGNRFDHHPVSGIAMRGTPVMRLDEVFAACKLAHEVLGGPVTIGWDVAMTHEGPCITEGNTIWGADLHAMADPSARRRLRACFLRVCNNRGTGFPAELPQIGSSDLATVVFRAKGEVQGVGYRRWIAGLARGKRLSHTARNLKNGDVEVRLSGPLRILEFALMSAMHGPPKAHVSEIEVVSLRPLTRRGVIAIPTASQLGPPTGPSPEPPQRP